MGSRWFCLVDNHWFKHPPLPRASCRRYQTTCRPTGPPLQARRGAVDRWQTSFDLSANRYPGVVHPQGFRYLKQISPRPISSFYPRSKEGIEFEKSVFMIHGENTTVIHYELRKNNRPDVSRRTCGWKFVR